MEDKKNQVIVVNKPQGKTPLELIQEYRASHPKLEDQKLGYAGRLDPLASGVMLILVGDENTNRAYYERLPKTYIFEIVAGCETDTYDPMGIIRTITEVKIEKATDSMRHECSR